MTKTALIDCRPFEDYCAGHMNGACSLPADQLFERMHELPKRDRALSLCGDEERLEQAASYLIERGHTVSEKIIWSKELEDLLRIDGGLETGAISQQLWKPAALWQRFVETIAPMNHVEPGLGLDIACGAGRDMIYLAMQGWQMTGVDRSEDALQRVAILAKQAGVSVMTIQADLETGGNPFSNSDERSLSSQSMKGANSHGNFPDNSFDLVTVGRYLHRPLFPFIRRLLKPSGVVVYQTFMQGCENTTIGRPRNPNFLLKPNELSVYFPGFEILLDEVETLDDGRPVSAFVARKSP